MQIIGCDCEGLRYIRVGYDLNADLKKVDVGEVVLIYDDPLTKKKPEGEAVIILIAHKTDAWLDNTVMYLDVIFADEWEKHGLAGTSYPRTLLTNVKYKGGEK